MALFILTPLLAVLGVLLSFLPAILAQAPTNDTLPPNPRYYSLASTQDGMSTNFQLYPLTDSANLDPQAQIKGKLILVTDLTTGLDILRGSIACISCDPGAYTQLGPAGVISLVTNGRPGAIVLFSKTSTHCDYTGDPPVYGGTYTTTNTNASLTLSSTLQMGDTQAGTALIKATSDDSNRTSSSNGGGYDGRSPTTAVAMIILYSITGIITALFLIIIVVGAVRAHRHPERYGPRNMLGRPRQSRARGIARAMLETIPIVKFGEKENDKPIQQAGDVELGTAQRDAPTEGTPAAERRPSTDQPAQTAENIQDNAQPEAVTTETVAATGKVPGGKTDTDANAESGLACSVCTDDFAKGQDVRVLPCNHKFHPECIDPWLLNVSGTCPLCRVDLRPTTSRTAEPEASTTTDRVSVNGDGNGASTENAESSNAQERRRSRTGISSYIQHTLNRRRMRDATPEERVAALRRLRTVESAHEHEAADQARNRISNRLSRAFNHDSIRGSTVVQDSRRGSYAG